MLSHLLALVLALVAHASAQSTITDVLNSEPAQGSQVASQTPQVGALLSSLAGAAGAAGNASASFRGGPSTSGKPVALDDFSHVSVTASSRDIVSGMVEAFMNKAQLEQGEKQCLETNLGQAASSVIGIGRDATNAVKGLMQNNNASHASLMPLLTDAGMKVLALVTTSTGLLKNCVRGDALVMLNRMGHNLANWSYIGNRLLVSGIDVAHCFADSIVSFEEKNFKKFGADIGTALRKMLLSNSTNGTRLPEGYPKEAIIGDVTDGLMTGFFAEGTTIRVQDKDPKDPKVDINIDLHKCIADNQQVFRAAWKGVWDLIASFAVNRELHGLVPSGNSTANPGQQWTGELMVAMVGVPGALATCGIDQATEKMMFDAVKSLRHLNATWTFPNDQIKAATGTEKVAKAVEAWTSNDFKTFGIELGKLLREFVLLAFPAKYAVDANGRLRTNLMSQSAEGSSLRGKLGPEALFPAFLVATSALLVSVGLVLGARRGLRSRSRDSEEEVE